MPKTNTMQMHQARALFLRGNDVESVAARLGKSTSTIYNWLDKMGVDVTGAGKAYTPLPTEPTEQSNKFATGTFKEGRVAGGALAQSDPYFRVICALYWGEGRLGDTHDEDISEVSLASSDDKMVKIWLKWMLTHELHDTLSVRIHVSMNNVLSDSKLTSYWKHELGKVGYTGEVDVKRIDQYVTTLAAKSKKGSAYVTCYNPYLRGLIIGGIDYLKANLAK